MLANRYTEEFASLLDFMRTTVVGWLDDSSVGIPSATRLRKVLDNVKCQIQGDEDRLAQWQWCCGGIVQQWQYEQVAFDSRLSCGGITVIANVTQPVG
jgi:hypothetical protein